MPPPSEFGIRAPIIGFLFLSGFPLYSGGSYLLTSENDAGLGIVLVLLNSVALFVIGLLLSSVVLSTDSKAGYFYFIGQSIHALCLAISAFRVFGTGNDQNGRWYYRIAMLSLGLGSVRLLNALSVSNRIPHWLSQAGTIGYTSLIAGIIFEIIGLDHILVMLFMMPSRFFQVAFSAWLILMGFTQSHYKEE